MYPMSRWSMWLPDSTALAITMDKCIGDPTKNNGFLQRAELRFVWASMSVVHEAGAYLKP
jgi:hypothetical protein